MNNYNFQPQVVDETPVFNFANSAHSQFIEREGIIVVQPISPSPHRNETLTIGGFKGFGYWDKGKTQKYWFGTVVGNNPDGSKKFKKINIVDGRMYHLNNPEDAMEWHILRHHFSIKGSVNQFGKARWKVVDERKDSKETISKSKAFVDVYEFLAKMSDSRIKSFGRIFGLDPINNPADVIKGQLLAKAMEKPNQFIPYMKDTETTNIREAFHRAISTNVITFRLDRGYLFNDSIPLGINEEMAIGHLMANKDLFINIDMLSRQKDNSLNAEEKEYKIPFSAKAPQELSQDDIGKSTSDIIDPNDF